MKVNFMWRLTFCGDLVFVGFTAVLVNKGKHLTRKFYFGSRHLA